jgi:ubiquinone/menaquinone biosynthesis C-methylase UbiE
MESTALWARGDYPKVADDIVAALGPLLAETCSIGPGQRVLDVAAGCGNVSIAAAERGARVVASDLTPELLEVGRERAAARGLELDWVEADAEALPFGDEEFDVVVSCIGVMFAPDHRRAAAELVRVCRPGGTIGLISWTPDGTIGAFFRTFARYVGGPPQPPALWGSPEHVRALFGERVEWDRLSRDAVVCSHFEDPAQLCDYYKEHFGPTIAAYEAVAGDAERSAALDRDFLRFAEENNRGNGRALYEFEYLLARGTRR